MLGLHTRARSLAWLERPADNREVSSSNLVGPTTSSSSVVFSEDKCFNMFYPPVMEPFRIDAYLR